VIEDTSGMAHRLEIRCSRDLTSGVSDLLTGLGCIALEECSDGSVFAYADTNAELSNFAVALQTEFESQVSCQLVAIESDWQLAFTQNLQAIELTPTLWVEPKGLARAPSGIRRIVLEPAFAFGYGEHPTTRLVVRWLERALQTTGQATVLDFGTGTGILALAAVAFGASRVLGLDIDPEAVRAAKANAALNDASAHCEFSCERLDALKRDFDVIVANVDSTTLVSQAHVLATRMSAQSVIALTGFLEESASEVVSAMTRGGLQTRVVEQEDGWVLVSNWPEAR